MLRWLGRFSLPFWPRLSLFVLTELRSAWRELPVLTLLRLLLLLARDVKPDLIRLINLFNLFKWWWVENFNPLIRQSNNSFMFLSYGCDKSENFYIIRKYGWMVIVIMIDYTMSKLMRNTCIISLSIDLK